MLPKKLYTRARKRVEEIAKAHINENLGKIGLAAVPVDLESDLVRAVEHIAQAERHSFGSFKQRSDTITEFLQGMSKLGIIAPHPWGGWMAPNFGPIISKEEGELRIKAHLNDFYK